MWSYSNMNGPRDGWSYHTKYVRQKKTNTMWNHSYVECNFKKWHKWTYLQNKNRLTEIENKIMVTKGGVWRRWINQEFGINTLTLLYSSIGVCCVLCLVTQSCLTLCNPIARLLCQEIFQVRILEWVAITLLQGIFPNQGSNPGLQLCRWCVYRLSHPGSPMSTAQGTLLKILW